MEELVRGQRVNLGIETDLVSNQVTDDSLINNLCMSVLRKTQLILELKGSVLSFV